MMEIEHDKQNSDLIWDENDQHAIDMQWAKEVELRIDASNAGKMQSLPMSEVFEEIDRLKRDKSK